MIRQSVILFLLYASSCSLSKKSSDCENQIRELSHTYKEHLIFCSYYFDKAKIKSGADSILSDLSYYRDTVDVREIKSKDSLIIINLIKDICSGDTNLLIEIRSWCNTSVRLSKIREQTAFTLEGYMDYLKDFKSTNHLIAAFETNERTVSSLSTYEMEGIYFSSISIISALQRDEQDRFFKGLADR